MTPIRDLPVHFTALKMIGASPKHYLHAATKPWGGGTLAQRMGTHAHAATFEPHRLVEYAGGVGVDAKGKPKKFTSVRNGGFFDDFKAKQPADAVIVNAKELATAMAVAAALRGDPVAAPILFGHGVEHEQVIEWMLDGRACSSRPDARHPGVMIADLKKCRSAEPGRFTREALWAYYHAQLRFYDLADAHETGRTVWDPLTRKGDRIDLFMVAVEGHAPHAVSVFELDDTAIVHADRCIAGWWSRLMSCEAENVWPGYQQCAVPFIVDDPENFIGGAAPNDDGEEADTSDEWNP